MKYYISKTFKMPFNKAVERIKSALEDVEFGLVSELDIDKILKEKLHVDYRRYKILGVCNPPFAYQSLLHENKIGTMLPCNVIVQEITPNQVEIAAIDPLNAMQGINNEQLNEIAKQVRNKLVRAINNVM